MEENIRPDRLDQFSKYSLEVIDNFGLPYDHRVFPYSFPYDHRVLFTPLPSVTAQSSFNDLLPRLR
jgi:hypothetical protein